MATQDLSRHLFQPAKYYSSARMQQGRVVLDSDVNEAEMLADEGKRLALVDVVGPHGSSTAGFTIGNFQDDVYDFEIAAGSYFLGGLRLQIELAAGGAPQRFRSQTDWLQSSRADITFPEIPETDRSDFVYLVGWEQTVSAVEDLELVEHALGGRDTTVRQRRMQRVRVVDDAATDCATAFDDLVDDLQTGGHIFDPVNHELKSAARLAVTLAAVEASDDECASPVANGYSGGENQAIRIQMIATDRFLWAYDNASPLYRVTAARTDTTVTITFLTPPQEQGLFPLKGQVVEILPWGAVLPNGEHTADHPIASDIGGGVYARATATYDPVSKTLTATLVNTTLFDQMLAWFATADVDEADQFFFLRVWGPDGAPMGTFGYPSGTPQVLPGTGLSVNVTGAGIVGDHWILAARTLTPTQLVPWDLLLTPVPPHGPRRFYCPLGMLSWVTPPFPGEFHLEIDSCRRPFRPLTRLRGCCSVTVGDGVASFGDYTSIQDAIDALPTDEPGKVCVLPGTYEQRVDIKDRKNIVIEGCGPRTLLRTPPGNATSDAIIAMVHCVDLTIRNLTIDATGQFGITARSGSNDTSLYCLRITLEKLAVTTRRDANLPAPDDDELAIPLGSAAFPLCTVATLGAFDVRILDCTFTEIGDRSAAANVLLAYTAGATVRNCKILSPPADGATVSQAWAGLQIAGFCGDITVERCLIEGGLGHGITLGSAQAQGSTPHPDAPPDPGNSATFNSHGNCPSVSPGFPEPPDPESPGAGDAAAATVVLVPDLGPSNVRIRRNRIRGMGASGISVLGFWPEPPDKDSLVQISTNDLVIADNIIEDNCGLPPEDEVPAAVREVAARGGIVLAAASGARIHDNIIRRNGSNHHNAVCGIYVLHGEDITVENNQINDNGHRVPGTAFAGHRAGIALQAVGRPLRGTPATDLSQPAVRVRGNTVLQPAGRALQIYGVGPIYVEGNVLVSQGLDGITGDERKKSAHCIDIRNVGLSPELITAEAIPEAIVMETLPPLVLPDPPIAPYLVDGRILFTNNMVRFSPVAGAGNDIRCVTLLQSYGDVAVLGNQFFATLAAGEGPIFHDTIVLAWSTRTTGNRWEDPLAAREDLPPVTVVSAATVAYMNTTTLNQASRCIHVYITTPGEPESNPISNNQHYSNANCEPDPEFEGLPTS